jgi:ubiquinone/menaquinone biosynthesis C-methylase UbiE
LALGSLAVSKHGLERALYYLLWAVVLIYVVKQVRKPDKWAGRFFLWLMNISHSGVTDWGLRHAAIKEDFTILDVGCGGGRTIEKLAGAARRSTVHGVDYAPGSVAASRARNAQLIKAGRAEITQATVSRLPFAEGRFDLVTAVETQYYWPEPIKDMQEILRVLKPGGTLLVIAESYKKGANDWLQGPVMKLIGSANLSVEEQRQLFAAAGYTDIQIFEERAKGWICATGKRSL